VSRKVLVEVTGRRARRARFPITPNAMNVRLWKKNYGQSPPVDSTTARRLSKVLREGSIARLATGNRGKFHKDGALTRLRGPVPIAFGQYFRSGKPNPGVCAIYSH